MDLLRKIVRDVLRESVIEETQTGQKDLEKLTNDVLTLVAHETMKEKAHVVWLTGNQQEPVTRIPMTNTLMMNEEGFSEIGEFVKSTNIRIAPTPIAIGGRKNVKGELEYGPPSKFNEEYYKIWLKYSKEDLDEINEIFNKDGREVTATDIYFKLFYMFYSTLLHELQHAYDAWRSGGKAFGGQLKKSYTSAQEKADMLRQTKSGYDEMTPEEIEAINKSSIDYLNLVHEINARYAQAMHKIVLTGMDYETFDDVKEDWNKVYRSFKANFDGWRHLSDKMKKKLTRRLAKAYQEAIENLKTASEKYSKEELDMVSLDEIRKNVRETLGEIQKTNSLVGGKINYNEFVDWAKGEADKISKKIDKFSDLEFQWAEDSNGVKLIVYKDGVPLGYVGLEKFNDGYKISTLGVKDEARGVGIATKAYDYLISKIKLYSDKMQTPEARNLWIKLASKYNVKGYNKKDNAYFDVESNGSELISKNPKYELYSDKSNDNFLVISK